MWNMIQAVVRRLQSDKELEERLKRNREALERKRMEARISVPEAAVGREILEPSIQV